MYPAEIVPNGIEPDHVSMVLEFLAEGVRQPREPRHAHAHGEVPALDVGRADVV